MEEKNTMTAERSLEIITEQIERSRQVVAKDTGRSLYVSGLCTMGIENFMLDYVMNARRESVQFLIFSKKHEEIAHAIGTQMNHGVTILDGHGWYTGQERKVICLLARKSESTYIFRLIKMIDPNAFVSQSSVIGVYGEGFDEMKVKIKKEKVKNENSIRHQQPAQVAGNTPDSGR